MTPMRSRGSPFGFILDMLSFLLQPFALALGRALPAPLAGQEPFRPSRLATHRKSFWPGGGIGTKPRALVAETIIRFGHGDCRHRRGLGRPLLAT